MNGKEILERLAAIRIHRWNYKCESDTDVPHIGPMAQDFKAAFYPGREQTQITTLEFDGVEERLQKLEALEGRGVPAEPRR